MRAFVTGGTGLLGNNLIRCLLHQGYQVRTLVRVGDESRAYLRGIDVELVNGDMLDVPAFGPHLQGCDVIFHAAAYLREYFQTGEHWPMLYAVNVQGTLALFKQAYERGVRRIIYVSTAGVVGTGPDGRAGDESSGVNMLIDRDLYFRSKVLAEAGIRSLVDTFPIEVVSILPGWLFGPHDVGLTTSGRLITDYMKRRLPGFTDGGACVVDARDVALAMIQAVTRGRAGERYIVAGPYLTFEQILQALQRVTGVKPPRVRIPYPLLLAGAFASEAISIVTNRPILISRNAVRSIRASLRWSSAKALRELGVTFRGFDETLSDEIQWFRQYGYI